MSDSSCCSELLSYAAVEEDCTGGLIIEVFDDSNRLVLMFYFMVAHKAYKKVGVKGVV